MLCHAIIPNYLQNLTAKMLSSDAARFQQQQPARAAKVSHQPHKQATDSQARPAFQPKSVLQRSQRPAAQSPSQIQADAPDGAPAQPQSQQQRGPLYKSALEALPPSGAPPGQIVPVDVAKSALAGREPGVCHMLLLTLLSVSRGVSVGSRLTSPMCTCLASRSSCLQLAHAYAAFMYGTAVDACVQQNVCCGAIGDL